ncbi:MAG: HNH endonuclease [Desulfobulbaceae bacterium DB1]|nr:MAG: HNH endonuclease [Desulfobulbaceae bacterium DB1]
MTTKQALSATNAKGRAITDALRDLELRQKTYREQALKIFPWVCAKCGREFSGKKLKDLTVHHKDHNHDNNPPDGSNWELLCLYCHDNEHSRFLESEWQDGPTIPGERPSSVTHNPFANLQSLLAGKTKDKK